MIPRKLKVPQGAAGIVLLDGAIWVASEGFSALTKIDPASGTIVSTTHLSMTQQVYGLATDGRYLYSGGVVRFDPRTNSVAGTVDVPGAFGGGIAYADGAVWVQGSGGVFRVLTSAFSQPASGRSPAGA